MYYNQYGVAVDPTGVDIRGEISFAEIHGHPSSPPWHCVPQGQYTPGMKDTIRADTICHKRGDPTRYPCWVNTED
jgi:hypothetical protein